MKILYHPRFAREYKKLPVTAQRLVEEHEMRFWKNPFDARLKTHKLHSPLKDFFAFSTGHRHRIIFDFADRDTVRFYSVGDHDIDEERIIAMPE